MLVSIPLLFSRGVIYIRNATLTLYKNNTFIVNYIKWPLLIGINLKRYITV